MSTNSPSERLRIRKATPQVLLIFTPANSGRSNLWKSVQRQNLSKGQIRVYGNLHTRIEAGMRALPGHVVEEISRDFDLFYRADDLNVS